MLVPFIIEPGAYDATEFRSDVRGREEKRLVKDFMDFWHDHGVLVMPEGYDWDACLENLGQNQRDRLQVAYTAEGAFRKRNRRQGQICWNELESHADLNQCAAQLDIGMFILEPVRAMELGLSGDDLCKRCGQVEITLWGHVKATDSVTALRVLAQKPIQPEDTQQAIWEERLRGYAEYSKEIAIVDPFVVRGLSRDHQPSTALPFLLKRLMGCELKNGKRRNLHVVSTYGDEPGTNLDDSLAKIKSNIERFCDGNVSNSNIAKIKFSLLSHADHGAKFHDRWIRFDNNVITLDHGLAMMEPNCYSFRKDNYIFGFGLKPESVAPDYIRDEERLAVLCDGLNEHFTIPA